MSPPFLCKSAPVCNVSGPYFLGPLKEIPVKNWRPVRMFLVLASVAVGGASACGGGEGDPSDCPTFAQVTIWQKCLPCHVSTKTTPADRMDATFDVDYDRYESAKMNGALANVWVMANLMPPPPMPPATPEEKASLQAWVECGMPQ
jgi:hypothetical protein